MFDPHPHPLNSTLLCLATTLDALAGRNTAALPGSEMHLNDKATLVREDQPRGWQTKLTPPPGALLCLDSPLYDGNWEQTEGSLTVVRGERMTF